MIVMYILYSACLHCPLPLLTLARHNSYWLGYVAQRNGYYTMVTVVIYYNSNKVKREVGLYPPHITVLLPSNIIIIIITISHSVIHSLCVHVANYIPYHTELAFLESTACMHDGRCLIMSNNIYSTLLISSYCTFQLASYPGHPMFCNVEKHGMAWVRGYFSIMQVTLIMMTLYTYITTMISF